MGNQTRIEDMTMTLSSAGNTGPLTGILFPNGTSASSKVRNGVVNVRYTGGGPTGPILYGLLVSDTTTPNTYSPADAIRGVTVNVSTNSTGPTGPHGVNNNGTSYFAIRDSNIYCTGPTGTNGPIGVITTNTGCFTTAKFSSLAGTLYDIYQAPSSSISTIQLNASDLINANAGPNGFTVNTEPFHVYYSLGSRTNFGGAGSVEATPTGTYYLRVGTLTSNFCTPIVGYTFPQKAVVFEGIVSATLGITGTQVVTVNFYKSTTQGVLGTQFAGPIVLNSSTQSARFQNSSTSFRPGIDYIQVQCIVSGAALTVGNDIDVGIALY